MKIRLRFLFIKMLTSYEHRGNMFIAFKLVVINWTFFKGAILWEKHLQKRRGRRFRKS